MTPTLRADCQALQVGELELRPGSSHVVDTLGGATALIFSSGEARVVISGRARVARKGDIEVVCHGEDCTISATRDAHIYVVVAKQTSSG